MTATVKTATTTATRRVQTKPSQLKAMTKEVERSSKACATSVVKEVTEHSNAVEAAEEVVIKAMVEAVAVDEPVEVASSLDHVTTVARRVM